MLNNFLLMIQFLTRIRVNRNLECKEENFRWGSIFMPVIGLVIGGIQWILYKAMISILPVNASVVFVILAGIMLTGAMHMDGLGDTCDGFFSFKGSDKIIEIMKDSRIGTYSCIAIVIDLLLRYTLLCYVLQGFSPALVVSPVISRLSTLFLVAFGKTAKSTGTGNLFIDSVCPRQFFIGILIVLAVVLLIVGMNPLYAIILILAAILMSELLNLYAVKKIGGLTGDLLGANNEIIEILMMILMCIFIKM